MACPASVGKLQKDPTATTERDCTCQGVEVIQEPEADTK